MSDIWRVIAEIAEQLHQDRLEVVCERVGQLDNGAEFHRIRASFGPTFDNSLVDALDQAWQAEPELMPKELAAALLVAGITASRMGKCATQMTTA